MDQQLTSLRQDFINKCDHLGLALNEQQIDKLLEYLSSLLKWSKAFNLTAITDPKQALNLHLLDSVAISPFIKPYANLLDVGTGGGLPGIPLAILHPDKEFSLLDTNSKKTRYLKQVVYELGLTNVQVINQRVQDFDSQSGYACILSRAFASIQDMVSWTQHLLAEKGHWLAMKGLYPQEEISALPETIKQVKSHQLIIDGVEAERHLVFLQKTNTE